MSNLITPYNRNRIQTMSSLIRYNNAIHFHDENVAEHSFYVAIYAMDICDIIETDNATKLNCIQKALIHDVHEIELSDIPHNVKEEFPRLNDICLKFEKEFNDKSFPYIKEESERITRENIFLISAIVELADVISVLQYSLQEIRFRNDVFIDVNTSATLRITDCLNRIERIAGKEKRNKLEKLIY